MTWEGRREGGRREGGRRENFSVGSSSDWQTNSVGGRLYAGCWVVVGEGGCD